MKLKSVIWQACDYHYHNGQNVQEEICYRACISRSRYQSINKLSSKSEIISATTTLYNLHSFIQIRLIDRSTKRNATVDRQRDRRNKLNLVGLNVSKQHSCDEIGVSHTALRSRSKVVALWGNCMSRRKETASAVGYEWWMNEWLLMLAGREWYNPDRAIQFTCSHCVLLFYFTVLCGLLN